jgi:tetratricopeptide (TPR) repeat protein
MVDSTRRLFQDELTEATDEREEVGVGGLPSEAQLALLCLDYLRDLRRSYTPQDLVVAEGLDADYLSAAIYSLSRCFLRPPQLLVTSEFGNDAWLDRQKVNAIDAGTFPPSAPDVTRKCIELPDLTTINMEIMYSRDPDLSGIDGTDGDDNNDEQDCDVSSWYNYDDAHSSNSHRFYLLNGLASGQSLNGPLTLGEITAAGLAGLGARSRLDAEREMIRSPLFEQFVEAVRAKEFFRDPDSEGQCENPDEELLRQQKAQEIYEDRYRKVVAKFRTKLATKAQQEGKPSTGLVGSLSGNLLALSAADHQRRRREKRIELARVKARNLTPRPSSAAGSPVHPNAADSVWEDSSVAAFAHNVIDLEEAERLKSQGNSHMQKKEYSEAADAYTAALKLSPAGPQSHIYFSNRAASLLSMKMFNEAILDSERSLALKPDYGKAHARLGLAHFLLGDYRQAMEAYTVSLKYDPENKSSKNYLEKSARRLATQEKERSNDRGVPDSSFSVVSEWDKSETGKSKKMSSSSIDDQDERKKLIVQKEAEKYKVKGNSYMASRDYISALEAYSTALELCPDGANSHVYYSNRAAALCYLERYEQAEEDSRRSLTLEPTYVKAHARLGLSRFFMGDYKGAVEAYTSALECDPHSSASKSYLAKAQARLDRENGTDGDSNAQNNQAVIDEGGQHGMESREDRRLMQDPEIQQMSKESMEDPAMIQNMMESMQKNGD